MAEAPKAEIPKVARERLAAQQAAGQLHPDADLLAGFVERTLAAGERELVLAHLAVCEECREVVAVAQPPEPEETEVTEAERSRWLRWEHLQWGALAAVLVVGAAVLLRAPWMQRDVPPEVQRAAGETPAAVASQPTAREQTAKPLPSDEDQARQNTASVNGKAELQVKAGEAGKLAELRDGEMDRVQSAEPKKQVAREEAPAAAAPRESKDDADRFRERAVNAPVTGREGSVGSGVAGGAGMSAAASSGSRPAAGMVGGALSTQAVPQAAPVTPPLEDKSRIAQSNSEVVSVEARADSLSKDEKEAGEKAKTEAAYERPAELPMKKHEAAGNVANYRFNAIAAAARWSVSSTGRLQRSLDRGNTWHEVSMPGRITRCTDGGRTCRESSLGELYRFRAVAVLASEVWAGGSPGDVVFHSADGGQTWVQQELFPGLGVDVAHDIVRIDFRDLLHGTVETSAKEVWVTEDGGKTWKRK